MRFDSLALPVYRQVGDKLSSVVSEAGLDLQQIDEVLLAGSSTLLPGLQQHLALLVAPTTPVTATLDPSQVIAIGCALQALHLSQLPAELALPDVLSLADREVPSLSSAIGLAAAGSDDLVKIIEASAPLPTRRRVSIPVQSGASKVGVELYEVKESVKVTKIPPPPKEEGDEEFSDEEEEDEEVKEIVLSKGKFLGFVSVETEGKEAVELEIIIKNDASAEVRFWAQGQEEKASRLEL